MSRMLSVQAIEMVYLQSLKGCAILDKTRNEYIRKELKVFYLRKVYECHINWKDHVQQMPHTRLPRAALHYRSKGKLEHDRPKKLWVDLEAEASILPNP